MNKLIKKYLSSFQWKKRGDDDIVILKDNAPKELQDSVMEAHGNRMPNDWIYEKYYGILDALDGYTIENIDDVDNYEYEIIDGLIDVYTSNITAWLNDSDYNVYYLTEALENEEPKDGFKALQLAQYKAIQEIFSFVRTMLENRKEDGKNE